MKYFVRLYVCMAVPFCILCMHKLYMYICICLLYIIETAMQNRCTDMFYDCVILVVVNKRSSHKNKKKKASVNKWPWSKLTLTLIPRSGSSAECGLTTDTTVAVAGTTGCLVLAISTCPTRCSGCGVLTRLADNCDQWKRLKKYMATHFYCLSSLFNSDQDVKLFWACLRRVHFLSLSQCKSPHCVMHLSAASIILVSM